MRVFLVLFLAVIGAIAIQQPNACTPDPPKNVKIVETTSTEIYVTFEDPDDMETCPILLYRTRCEEEESGVNLGSIDNKLHPTNFTGLKPATAYRITSLSVSEHFVESTHVLLHTSTK